MKTRRNIPLLRKGGAHRRPKGGIRKTERQRLRKAARGEH